jgi:hypothetical protein
MEGSGAGRGERDVVDERGTWFAQQLGERWTEVEPGIYRFDAGVKNEHAIRMAAASEPASDSDPLETLNPVHGEPDAVEPTRRLFGRRAAR